MLYSTWFLYILRKWSFCKFKGGKWILGRVIKTVTTLPPANSEPATLHDLLMSPYCCEMKKTFLRNSKGRFLITIYDISFPSLHYCFLCLVIVLWSLHQPFNIVVLIVVIVEFESFYYVLSSLIDLTVDIKCSFFLIIALKITIFSLFVLFTMSAIHFTNEE